jgi:hypothetical protein
MDFKLRELEGPLFDQGMAPPLRHEKLIFQASTEGFRSCLQSL